MRQGGEGPAWPIGRVGGIQSWGLCAAMDMVRRRRYPRAWPVAVVLHGQGLYIILSYAYAFVDHGYYNDDQDDANDIDDNNEIIVSLFLFFIRAMLPYASKL